MGGGSQAAEESTIFSGDMNMMSRMKWLVVAPAVALAVGACAELPTEPFPAFAPSFTVSTGGVVPTVVAENIAGEGAQVCNDPRVNNSGTTWQGLKVDPPVSGSQLGLTYTLSGSENQYLAWSAHASVLVKAVVVKGSATHIYSYNPPAFWSDAGLTAPLNNGGQIPAVSHFVICYTVVETAEGCTPGFWKNRAITIGAWGVAGYSPHQPLNGVFTVAGVLSAVGTTTMLEALDLPGGSGVQGGARILLRAATAAVLNAAHPDVDYELDAAGVIAQVNAALTKGSDTDSQWRARMVALAATLDGYNNAGCPLGALAE
jgi:hypothetical protein